MFPSYEFWLGAAFAGIIAVLIVKMCENKRAKEKGPKKIPEENDERYNQGKLAPFFVLFFLRGGMHG